MNARLFALALTVIWLAFVASVALAAPLYHLTPLPSNFSGPYGINSSGQVVGTVTNLGLGDPAIYYNSTVTDLGTLGGLVGMGEGINESGQAAGVSADNTSHGKAFLWSAGMMTNLGTLGGTFSQANGINASAQVVGYSGTGDRNTPNMSEIIHAFSYKNGIMTDLGAFGGNYSVASAVNDSGLIVGEFGTWDYHTIPAPVHAFSFDGTTMNDLGTLGGLISAASAVNRAGKVVGGAYDSAGNDHAFLYYSTMTDLGTLGGATSSAAGINNLDQIVGDSYTAGGGDHAFLDTGATMLDLNQLLDGSGAGWTLNNAYAINDSGWIVGSGNNGSFLLTPVPEPPSIVLGLIAGVALLAIGRRLVA